MADKPTATKCTCPGGGKTDPTCPIHGTGSSVINSPEATASTSGAK